MTFSDRVFQNEAIMLDNRVFRRCTMINCKVVYAGGNLDMEDVVFENCEAELIGPARGTLELLKKIARSSGQNAIHFKD
jgi:hypothetical protein